MTYRLEIPENFLVHKDFAYNEKSPTSKNIRWLNYSLRLRDDINKWMIGNGLGYSIVQSTPEHEVTVNVPAGGRVYAGSEKIEIKYYIQFNSPGVAMTFKLKWL